jgi:hypothetical protein
MSGHGTSRRRSYGKRQRELRDRRGGDLTIDLEGPTRWPRGAAWDDTARMRPWTAADGSAMGPTGAVG